MNSFRVSRPSPPLASNRIKNTRQSPMPSNANGKRQVISLISSDVEDEDEDEDEAPPSKLARSSTQNFSIRGQSTQSRRPIGAGFYTQFSEKSTPSSSRPMPEICDDEYGQELVFWSQEAGNCDESFEQYGSIQGKVVGVRYYQGMATLGEHVLLKREPTNPYDHNAIQVKNVQNTQIGHIPRQLAAKLAPYMDDGSLLVSARISGRRGEFDCPIEISLYGTGHSELKEELRQRMQGDRISIDVLRTREIEAKRQKALEVKRQKEVEKREREERKVAKATSLKEDIMNIPGTQRLGAGFTNRGSSSRQAITQQPIRSLENIMTASQRFNPREVANVAEKFGAGEDVLARMPETQQPARLNTQLLPYQRQGLAWLLEKEHPILPGKGSKEVTQLWKRSPINPNAFTNIATNFSSKTEPKLARGGILADDMGLGKTLQMISLIVAEFASGSSCSQAGEHIGTTLIVAPLSVMSNWAGQIEYHVKKSSPLRVLTYHGPARGALCPQDFEKYDVVITTYGTLTSELQAGNPKNIKPEPVPRSTGLYSVDWRRVILDEGHSIRNPNTASANAACMLIGRSRWVLTGTPIVNTLKDLYSLIKFIGLTGGLDKWEIFNTVFVRPLIKQHDPSAELLLQALMVTICLRRRKDMSFVDLRLPEKKEFIRRIEFKVHEREKYDALKAEANEYVETIEERASAGNKSQSGYRHLLEVLLRLRQVCNHWKLCGERVTSLMEALNSHKTVSLTPENRKALQDMLQLSIETREECPICIDDLTGHKPVITNCGHVFGKDCITRVIETQHRCPMCRASIPDESILVEPARDLGVAGNHEESIEDDNGSSSKVGALLEILAGAHKKRNPKIVIFSQWCRFLDVLEPHLCAAGYKFCRLDGSMSVAARDAALAALESDPQTTIMLGSLGCASVGLNLTVANMVVLCDAWWAPAIEDQAVDRVHRLGQKRPCTVWRLVMEDSIENRTLDIQADKRKLMASAFNEKCRNSDQRSRTRLKDIKRLLS